MAKEKIKQIQFEELILKIKNKDYFPIYFLYGEEPYFIDEITNLCANSIIPSAEQDFNLAIIYGKETSMKDVIANARTFPFMGEKKLIIVKEAQCLLKDLKLLANYATNPPKSTILIFCFKETKTLDSRLNVVKIVSEIGAILESKKLYENQIPDWISRQLRNKNIKILPDAIQLFISHTGADLSLINNEINKIIIAIDGKKNIVTSDDISKYVGVNREYNIFELNKKISEKNFYESIRIINYFTQNRESSNLFAIISSLYSLFSKAIIIYSIEYQRMSKFEIARILGLKSDFQVNEPYQVVKNFSLNKLIKNISYLKDADLKLKGVNAKNLSNEDIFKELIFKIFYR